MRKEYFTALGLDEETVKKCATASAEELKGFIPKARFDEVNNEKKDLETSLAERDKQLNDLKKSSGDNAELQKQIEALQKQNAEQIKQHFGSYVNRIPNVTKNELAKSGAVDTNQQAKSALSSQTGSLYARIPYFGRINGGTSQNNDGNTDITSTNTTTYEQGFVVASRMDSWTERSFSKNITAGVDFMDNVAAQIAEYKLEVKQARGGYKFP